MLRTTGHSVNIIAIITDYHGGLYLYKAKSWLIYFTHREKLNQLRHMNQLVQDIPSTTTSITTSNNKNYFYFKFLLVL